MRKSKRKHKIIVGLSAGAGGFVLLIFITLCFWKVRKTKIERKTAAAALGMIEIVSVVLLLNNYLCNFLFYFINGNRTTSEKSKHGTGSHSKYLGI